MKVELLLNGRRAELECEPLEMLGPVLRRHGLSSVRSTCEIGVCGACTVLVDGEPTSGCLLLAAEAEGREVTTVEGLGEADPVRRAFEAVHAFQCGWCTPGFVLTAKALLEDDPEPSEEAVAEALGGNLCRCGSYVKIVAAVRAAAGGAKRGGRR
ncbi:MAG: (2Fe-2S)-binding protein [Solirubrobacterales bacterium]